MEPLIQRLLISDRELHTGGAGDLAERAHVLLRQQKETWPLLRTGYAALADVRTRTIHMDGFHVRLQWNPARIVSSAAAVDAESISRRKCFLCAANLPPEQKGILFAGDYLVLCNPFPIFEEHFTIPHTTHTAQRIGPSFGTMLDLARAMQKRYLLIYNGPRSGASAPDHQHFQTQLRRYFALKSTDRESLVDALRELEAALAAATGEKEEPMMNILASFDWGAWTVLVFPRAKHRPSMYFAAGKDRILISPAAVDCGGVLITPLEKDFERLTEGHVQEMFGEIFLPGQVFSRVCARLAGTLTPR